MYDSEEMECSCLRLSGLPKTTRLFVDFLDNFPKVSAFYAHPPDEAGLLASARAAREDGPSAEIRKTVVKILAEENRAFGSDESVARNLERLANGAVAVVTGQQTALFGGPAYTIYKALTAIHWADWLTRQGIDAVPGVLAGVGRPRFRGSESRGVDGARCRDAAGVFAAGRGAR